MIKTLTNLFKQDKEKFVVPKGVQDVIPVAAIFDDGIFKVGKDKYSKTYRFTDINYAVASREDKEAMFLEYSELLNSLDSGATTKITINNRRLNRLDFEQTILIPTTGDNLDEYREEYNKMLLDKATGANSIVQDKYITISINKKSVEDARTYFARVGADLIAHFGRLGSKCVELETDERLRIFHDFYRVGEESSFHFDIKETRKKGHDFKDYICPDTMEFEKDYFKMGNRYGRVLFLREYASYIKDSMVAELTDMNRNLMMSIDIVPVPTDEAVKEAENRLLGVETNITNWQRRQNANNNFSATVPYDMEQQKKEMKEFLDDLTTRDQRMMFAVITMVITADSKEQLEYSELLNSLDSGATTKITINNRRLNRLDFEQTILIPTTGDNLDEYREEYNKMLLDKATGANSIVQDKYITISINKKSVEDARTYFARVGADLIAHFGRLGSKCVELETDERLRIFHDFYRVGEESSFHFDIKETRKKGHDFKDYICPDTMEFEKDYFKMGNRYGRVLFLREYASYIKDSMVAELTDMNRNLMMSIDIVPVPTDEAVKEAENRLLGVETNITNWQRRQNANNNFSATVPYDMEQQKKEMKEFLDDLTTRDQRMMFAVITMVITADSKEQLENDTEALLTTARKHLCQFATLRFQQVDGLNTVMPFGTRKIDAFRTLTTESLSVFIPFRVQDIFHENGIYYGQNVISKNMIIADRKQLLNGNSFILGVSGGGKSFAAKGEIINQVLSSDADIIIIDPEREYSQLVNAMGGEVINISATSDNHINAMDMNKDYGDGANPVILKSEFIMSLCEQLIGGTNLGAKQKSIIDRCTASVYRSYQQNDYQGHIPTLQDFRAELLQQDEPEAKELALAIELFTHGSLNTFAKQTNVDTNNRLICYDILDLGKQLMPIGMLVVLDSILNRITQNRAKGKNTFIFIDEIYLLFQHEYSANFLFTLWKRVRKYGAYASGITQNVDDLLQSHTARTMLANSEFIIMLNQASTDRLELAKLLNISDLQMSYITNVEAGHGLIKVGSSLVPFANKFPKNTKLYKLMTTKPGEA